jgi:hypothetical protein
MSKLSRLYRERALEAATKAETVVDPVERRKLREMAATWDRMADYEEAHPSDSPSYHPNRDGL